MSKSDLSAYEIAVQQFDRAAEYRNQSFGLWAFAAGRNICSPLYTLVSLPDLLDVTRRRFVQPARGWLDG